MQNLSYGIKKPDSGDKGAAVFSALEGNMDVFIAHTHDGTDSAQIDILSLTRSTVNLPTASWSAVGSGYKQTVTCPGSVTLDKVSLRFRIRTGALENTFIFPTVTALSLTQFDVTVNDSSLDLEVLFV